jgi:ssRNA-specific RNase YbeY (16S rRNA maturation enzyme)
MNIIEQAKKMKKQQKSAAELERIAEEARWAKRDAEKQQLRNKVCKALKKSLESTKTIKFTFVDGGNYGEIVLVEKWIDFGRGKKRELQYLGTICLQQHTYMWRGSDESPEEEVTGTYIEFKEILNGDAIISTSTGCFKPEESIKSFEEEFAKYMVQHV